LNAIFTSEFEEDIAVKNKKPNLLDKWNNYWNNRVKKASIKRYIEADQETVGREVLLLTVIIGIFVLVIYLSSMLEIITTISALLVLNLYLGMRINRTEASINGQVPALLAGIKANIQANQTPVRAFIYVIDDVGDPLYSELA